MGIRLSNLQGSPGKQGLTGSEGNPGPEVGCFVTQTYRYAYGAVIVLIVAKTTT